MGSFYGGKETELTRTFIQSIFQEEKRRKNREKKLTPSLVGNIFGTIALFGSILTVGCESRPQQTPTSTVISPTRIPPVTPTREYTPTPSNFPPFVKNCFSATKDDIDHITSAGPSRRDRFLSRKGKVIVEDLGSGEYRTIFPGQVVPSGLQKAQICDTQ